MRCWLRFRESRWPTTNGSPRASPGEHFVSRGEEHARDSRRRWHAARADQRQIDRLDSRRAFEDRSGFAGEAAFEMGEREVRSFHSRRPSSKGASIDVKDIESLSTLPSKEELVSKVMFLINSSAQRLAVATAGVARNLAIVLEQVRAQKEAQRVEK